MLIFKSIYISILANNIINGYNFKLMIGKANCITLVLSALLASIVTPIVLKSGLNYPELSDAIRT